MIDPSFCCFYLFSSRRETFLFRSFFFCVVQFLLCLLFCFFRFSSLGDRNGIPNAEWNPCTQSSHSPAGNNGGIAGQFLVRLEDRDLKANGWRVPVRTAFSLASAHALPKEVAEPHLFAYTFFCFYLAEIFPSAPGYFEFKGRKGKRTTK